MAFFFASFFFHFFFLCLFCARAFSSCRLCSAGCVRSRAVASFPRPSAPPRDLGRCGSSPGSGPLGLGPCACGGGEIVDGVTCSRFFSNRQNRARVRVFPSVCHTVVLQTGRAAWSRCRACGGLSPSSSSEVARGSCRVAGRLWCLAPGLGGGTPGVF